MQLLWAALAGMIVYLDTTAVAQILICQPIIACPLWGYLAGQTEAGVLIGVVFQLIWLGNLQVGAAKFAEGNIGAFIAVALATEYAIESAYDGYKVEMFLLSIVIGLLAAYIGSSLAPFARRIVGRIVPKFSVAAEQGRTALVQSYFALAVMVHLAIGFLYTLIWLYIGNYILLAHQARFWNPEFYNDPGFGHTSPPASIEFLHRLLHMAVRSPAVTWESMVGVLLGLAGAIAVTLLVRRKTIPLFIAGIGFGILTPLLFSTFIMLLYYIELHLPS